jgi:hypothetical protein
MSKKSRASFGPEGTETPTSTPNATPEPSLTPAVEESLQGLLPRGETNPFYFPRCEYYTRYGSAFQMNSPEYWGTYHRSTRDSRYAKTSTLDITFAIEGIIQSKQYAHTGTIKNPYSFEKYRSMVEKPLKKLPPSNTPVPVPVPSHLDPRNNSTSNNIPYETLLDYRNRICFEARKHYLEIGGRLKIVHHNNYPGLLIKIPSNQGLQHVESRNQLWIAYYVAIVNHEARKANIPIEMVIRSSFGHLMPSIDVTKETFRINVGIVPKEYGCIIVQSLVQLEKVLDELKPCEIGEEWLKKKNEEILDYNIRYPESIAEWTNRPYEILQLKGDTANHTVAYQIVRNREMRDLLADYVAEELDGDSPNFVSPLVKMLDRLAFGKQVSMEFSDNDFKRNSRKWQASENEAIRNDESFWKLIEQCVGRVGGSPTLYTNRQVLGLYARLDKCNQEFIIRSASTQTAEDGGGSDSDYEDTATPLFYKKMILHTGMMAIVMACYLARYYVKNFLKEAKCQIDCKTTYYETTKALSLLVDVPDDLANVEKKKDHNIPAILFFDLNQCDNEEKGTKRLKHHLKGSVKVVVLDYTSANKTQIRCAIDDALAAEIKLLLLVNSGLKNEQFGADNNPYGTIRIITEDKEIRNKLYDKAQQVVESHPFPSTAHKIRKGYKQAGMLLTNQIIAKEDPCTTSNVYINHLFMHVSSSFKSLSDIAHYKATIFDQIRSSKQIDGLETELIELIQYTLRGYVDDWIEEQYQDLEVSYQLAMENWTESVEESQQPELVDRQTFENKYGNLDSLDKLLPHTDRNQLSQIAFDSFYDSCFDDLIEELKKCDGLCHKLVVSILSYYDFQFDLDPSDLFSEEFLRDYLILNLNQAFAQIEVAYITGVDKYGRTSLHLATKRNDITAVTELLNDPTVNVNAKDHRCETALHIAASEGFVEIMDKLITNGANRSLTDTNGHTPLDQARDAGQSAAIKLLE